MSILCLTSCISQENPPEIKTLTNQNSQLKPLLKGLKFHGEWILSMKMNFSNRKKRDSLQSFKWKKNRSFRTSGNLSKRTRGLDGCCFTSRF